MKGASGDVSAAPAEPPRGRAITAAGGLLLALGAGAALAQGFEGFLAVRGDEVLGEQHAQRLFTPGSVQKLVVAAATLHFLGPEHRIRTDITSRGERRGGVLRGDLVVHAAGDPSWSRDFFPRDPGEALSSLAEQLSDRGIRRVQGDLLVDVTRFSGRPFAAERPLVELGLALGAPVAGLTLDEGTFELLIAPGPRPGEPASAATEADVRIENRTVTVGAELDGKGSVEFLPRWGEGSVLVRGEYPIGEGPYRVDVALPDPALHAGEELRRRLSRRGIGVSGSVRVVRDGRVVHGPVLASFASPPLAEIVQPMLEDSSNWKAEMLLQLLALERTGAGRLDAGLEVLDDFLENVVGAAPGQWALEDASGLSPHDLLSPRAVVRLLGFVHRADWREALTTGLPRPGRGTLQYWSGLPPVAAKSGTIRNTLALAGYLETGDEPVIFAIFLNHDTRSRSVQRRDVAERLRAWLRLALRDS
jgi:D-alanyl-D-alanine carboxypeptidase/D-alanyl-D-alanine-endopeptidase (penicillin-binding protein 4)